MARLEASIQINQARLIRAMEEFKQGLACFIRERSGSTLTQGLEACVSMEGSPARGLLVPGQRAEPPRLCGCGRKQARE